MKIAIEKFQAYFNQTDKFKIICHATDELTLNVNNIDCLNYLSLIRPSYVHIVTHWEHKYLAALDKQQTLELINRISDNCGRYVVFDNNIPIPDIFLKQQKLTIIKTLPSKSYQLSNIFNELVAESSWNAGMVVIDNQGILITGKSGTGKSQLILSLVDRGHMWVSDEITELSLTQSDQIIGTANETLPAHIHIKGIGIIDMDKIYGIASHLTQHPVAAIIHLTNENQNNFAQISSLDQREYVTVLGNKLPMWKLTANSPQNTLLAELCAKQLILNNWGIDAADELEAQLTSKIQNNHSRTV